jgi:simple sugar transport system permease protein
MSAAHHVWDRITHAVKRLGLTRLTLALFLVVLWILVIVGTGLDFSIIFSDCLVRTGMNGVLVLALVPAVRAGVGLNFGLPLGIVCGLLGAVVLLDTGSRGPGTLAAAMLVGSGFGVLAGMAYAYLLERVKGQEMMVSIYVGFAAVAGASIFWVMMPLRNPELVMPLGGEGLRHTIVVADYYAGVLDRFGAIQIGKGFIPTGLLAFWLLLCGLMGLFLRTRVGIAMSSAGANPRFAEASGINVIRMRALGVVLSTVLGAIGILVFSQSYGFIQLYKAPLLMAFPTVAALLLGGASVQRATVGHVILGTFLFQSVLTTSLPLVDELVATSEGGSALANLPETARAIISNGIILYALTRREGQG